MIRNALRRLQRLFGARPGFEEHLRRAAEAPIPVSTRAFERCYRDSMKARTHTHSNPQH